MSRSVSIPPPATSALEAEYSTAVSAFVRRDHPRLAASLQRLLDLVRRSPSSPATHPAWYDLSSRPANGHSQLASASPSTSKSKVDPEQIIKVLKLYISSLASIYADPPQTTAITLGIPASSPISSLLPPSPPEDLLNHLQSTCSTLIPTTDNLLPPQLISTLILASLKLRPLEPALSFAHHLTEDWLGRLPDMFFQASIVPPANGKTTASSAEAKKRAESAQEGYLKVVELFVGEVLVKEGEWEMARAFLEGEMVMGSKRKENLYKHLRAMQNRPRSATSSPANSGILPPPSDKTSPSPSSSPTPRSRRSRSSSTSSSSSERTARPASRQLLQNGLSGLDRQHASSKGKGRAVRVNGSSEAGEDNGSEGGSETKRIYVNHPSSTPGGKQPQARAGSGSRLVQLLGLVRGRLSAASSWTSASVSALAVPLPIVVLVMMIIALRRRWRRNVSAPGAGVQVVDVRARLARVRAGGVMAWAWWYLRWWLAKFGGVWKLGTTITYV